MEGVTERTYRRVVLEENGPDVLGGTFTEFARVSVNPLSTKVLVRHLNTEEVTGETRRPVGLQIMGHILEHVAATAENAIASGAPLVDLNFGCPAKGAVRSCAGSGLLDHPPQIERMVRAVVDAVAGSLPVTAKIRAGGDDDSLLEDIAKAVEQGGASLLSIHCRTRKEKYADTADWSRLIRAKQAVSIPVCGNGGVECHADLERLRHETGCDYAMVARAALRDPWIFSPTRPTPRDMLRFFHRYDELMSADGLREPKRFARWKQLLAQWTSCGWPHDEDHRKSWLRSKDLPTLQRSLADFAREPSTRAGPRKRRHPDRYAEGPPGGGASQPK